MKKSSAKRVTRAGILATVMLLAACGGGSSKGSSAASDAPQSTTTVTTPTFVLPVEGNWDICITVSTGSDVTYTRRRITLTQLATNQLKLEEFYEYSLGPGCTSATGALNPMSEGTITLIGARVQDIGATPVRLTYLATHMTGSFPGKIALTGTNQLAFLVNFADTDGTQFPEDNALETFERVTSP